MPEPNPSGDQTEAPSATLLQVIDAFIVRLRSEPLVGPGAVDRLARLLHEDSTPTAEKVSAAMDGMNQDDIE